MDFKRTCNGGVVQPHHVLIDFDILPEIAGEVIIFETRRREEACNLLS